MPFRHSPPAHVAPAAERVRRFCSAVLAALDEGGGGELPEALARALGGGVAEVADGLRKEVAALDAAAAELRNLPTRFLGPQPAVAALLADLDAARARAARVLDSLDALHDPDLPHRPLADPPREPEPAPAEPGHGYDLIDEAPAPDDPPPADDTVVVIAGTDDTTGHPPADPTRQAARLFAEGQRHQRRQDFDRAESLYTEAIATDPRFGPAYSRRGQVRLARGEVDLAVADFDAALELDDTAAEAWCWRGDARAVAGRTAEAAADYARAVALRPDLARTRFNLAVALRKLGHTRRARGELDRVVADRPDFVPAHLQRALVRLQLGDRAGAEAGFRAALDLDPGCEEAKRQLAALAPAAAAGPPAPKAVGAKDAGQVVVNCPGCGEPGGVGWDRLGKVFACGKCKKRFGVKADGAAVELAQTGDGRWAEVPRLREAARKKRTRRAVLVGVVAAVLALPAAGVAGWRATRPATPAPAEESLPDELAARAELFARAWVAGDTRTMRRLAAPGDDRTVFAWYTRHRPPVALRPPAGSAAPPEGTRVDVSLTQVGTNRAVAKIRVSNAKSAGSPAELSLTWEERGEAWCFIPPAR